MSIRITSSAEWFRCIGPTATLAEHHAALARLVRLLVGDTTRPRPAISLPGRPAMPTTSPPRTSAPKQKSWRQALPRGKTAALPSTEADAKEPYSREQLERMNARFHHAFEHAIAQGKERPHA